MSNIYTFEKDLQEAYPEFSVELSGWQHGEPVVTIVFSDNVVVDISPFVSEPNTYDIAVFQGTDVIRFCEGLTYADTLEAVNKTYLSIYN
jgi:hypothetical protein